MLLRPRSSGYVTLRSSSPFHHPFITHNYLTDPHDVKVMVEGKFFKLDCTYLTLQNYY